VVARSPELVYGAEASLRIQPSDRLDMNFTYSYIEGKLDSDEDGSFFDSEDSYLPGSRIAPPKFTQETRYQLTENWRIGLSSLYSMDRDRFPNSSASEPKRDQTRAIGSRFFFPDR
jgi:iron complex outermembrane receptor protein